MSDTITPAYRAQNLALLRARCGYGVGGAKHGEAVAEYAVTCRAISVLDYGCGAGRLAKWLGKYEPRLLVREYDPAIKKKARLPKAADLVVCTDVLEHVEPDLLENVLQHLKRLSKRGAYLSIATRPSNKTLPDGRNAHLIVRPARWWVRVLEALPWTIRRMDTTDPRGVQLWMAGRTGV